MSRLNRARKRLHQVLLPLEKEGDNDSQDATAARC
jgi:hypothetical protein